MKNLKTGEVLRVTEYFITKNFWEYYVLDAKTNTKETKLCLVLGYESEIGDVHIPEVEPYIMSAVNNNLAGRIMPASGYKWVKE